jgi:hypothetical protein
VRNYVTTRADSKAVVAYYSLVYAAIGQKRLPAKLVKGPDKYDIPGMLLPRLAVDHREQGRGLGKALLKDAILRTMQAAEIAEHTPSSPFAPTHLSHARKGVRQSLRGRHLPALLIQQPGRFHSQLNRFPGPLPER